MCVTVDYTQLVQGVGCDMFRRNRITQEHRQRIVQAFENEDEDYFILKGLYNSLSVFLYDSITPEHVAPYTLYQLRSLQLHTNRSYLYVCVGLLIF